MVATREGVRPQHYNWHIYFSAWLSALCTHSLIKGNHRGWEQLGDGVDQINGHLTCSVRSESWVSVQLHTEGQNLGNLWDRGTDRNKGLHPKQDYRQLCTRAPGHSSPSVFLCPDHSPVTLSTQYSTSPDNLKVQTQQRGIRSQLTQGHLLGTQTHNAEDTWWSCLDSLELCKTTISTLISDTLPRIH